MKFLRNDIKFIRNESVIERYVNISNYAEYKEGT